MPSIDLSRYEKKKTAAKLQTGNRNSLMDLLNRDISFGSRELNDKKKEALYLELSSLLLAGINLKSSMELVISELKNQKDKDIFNAIQTIN